MNFIESRFVKEVSDITSNMYRQGWDERNGGNISYMIDEEYVRDYFPVEKRTHADGLGHCRNRRNADHPAHTRAHP